MRLCALAVFLLKRFGKGVRRAGERHAVLRALRPGKRRLDIAEVEMEHLAEYRVWRGVVAVEPLLLGISLDQLDAPAFAARRLEIGDGLLVDGEEAACR